MPSKDGVDPLPGSAGYVVGFDGERWTYWCAARRMCASSLETTPLRQSSLHAGSGPSTTFGRGLSGCSPA